MEHSRGWKLLRKPSQLLWSDPQAFACIEIANPLCIARLVSLIGPWSVWNSCKYPVEPWTLILCFAERERCSRKLLCHESQWTLLRVVSPNWKSTFLCLAFKMISKSVHVFQIVPSRVCSFGSCLNCWAIRSWLAFRSFFYFGDIFSLSVLLWCFAGTRRCFWHLGFVLLLCHWFGLLLQNSIFICNSKNSYFNQSINRFWN